MALIRWCWARSPPGETMGKHALGQYCGCIVTTDAGGCTALCPLDGLHLYSLVPVVTGVYKMETHRYNQYLYSAPLHFNSSHPIILSPPPSSIALVIFIH